VKEQVSPVQEHLEFNSERVQFVQPVTVGLRLEMVVTFMKSQRNWFSRKEFVSSSPTEGDEIIATN
jgi:hypothetical protein